MKKLFKLAIIGILLNIASIIVLGLIVYTVIYVFNPRIQISRYVFNRGGTPRINWFKSSSQKESDAFNDNQWKTYLKMWDTTKPNVQKTQDCQSKVDSLFLQLEPKHKQYLTAKLSTTQKPADDFISPKIHYYENLYNLTKQAKEDFNILLEMYALTNSTPEFLPDIFDMPTEGNHGKDYATTRLKQIQDDFNRLDSLSNNLNCINTEGSDLTQEINLCGNLVTMHYQILDVRYPIYKENYEVNEQYQLAIKSRTDRKTRDIEGCLNNTKLFSD